LREYAAARRLPEDVLRDQGVRDAEWQDAPAVAIPYRDQDGAEMAVRFRVSANGSNPFRWPRGTRAKGLVYGLDGWKLAARTGWALLVEGESDVHTCRQHGVPIAAPCAKEEFVGNGCTCAVLHNAYSPYVPLIDPAV